jgi:hypothetical protein
VTSALELEEKAIAAYKKAIDAVRECGVAYENAGMAPPDRIVRFMTSSAASVADPKPRMPQLPPPARPQQPPDARPSWLWLPFDSVTPTTAILAILRTAGGTLSPSDIKARIDALREEPVSKGVVANIGTRLDGKDIVRTDDGWSLLNREAAPVLHESNVWGPKEAFETYDIAEHRRRCVMHVLRQQELQVMQILRTLEECSWIHAPLSKDLLKTDLQLLDSENKAKRIGNSGKWRLTQKGAAVLG